MKIKILFILILFFSFTLFINAKEITVNNKIIEFNKIDDYDLQGFTTLDDKIFMILVNDDDTKSLLKVFDLVKMEEIYSTYYDSLGHANDITYNSKDNKIYVIAGGGSDEVYVFNGTDYKHETSFNIKLPIRSITYIEESDTYAVRLVTSGYILDSNFQLVSKWPFVTGMNLRNDVGRQGWSYYKGYLYYANWSWIRMGGNGTNNIMIYDLNGKKINELIINNELGEIEDIAFYNDKMILGFNGYDNMVRFYLEDIPTIEISANKANEKVLNENKTSKVNYWWFLPVIVLIFWEFLIILKRISKK